MKKLSLLKLAVLVGAGAWFALQTGETPVVACNNYYCGTQQQCGTLEACCLTDGGTGLDDCKVTNNGNNCDAFSPCPN